MLVVHALDKAFSTKCSQMMSISFILFSFTVSTTFRGVNGFDKFKWCRRLACLPALAPRVTGRLRGTIVGPTSRSDWSVRLVGPTIVSCKRFVRPVGQTVGCLILSDYRSDCRSVWTLRPTGRTDRQSDDQSRGSVGGTCCLRHSYIAAIIHEWWLI